MHAIEAHGLGKRYTNGVEAVRDLDLAVDPGEIFGFLGPNGAGKTTTVRLLNGSLTPSAGTCRVLDVSSQDDASRALTATLTEQARMYEKLSVVENLRFYASMYDEADHRGADSLGEDRIEELLHRMRLWEKRDAPLGTLSTGQRKRAQLARTLLHRPKVLFLDEPTSGLDPDAALEVTTLIRDLAREAATTVFLCTHNLAMAERVCDRFGFLKMGMLVAQGRTEELIRAATRERLVTIRTTRGAKDYPIERDDDINRRIREVLDQGLAILEVRQKLPTLEDVYFEHIGRRSHE
ncbi:MAG TPA: ABC transporter ATP-binding protein, partial [Spirochaetia bacterium]|nr:ABC transporter ATP-binding protein [Spirochaetia bacterium]